MNWLAHLHLGGTDALERLGQLAGDFVRGTDLTTLPAPVRVGVLRHRQIDRFTDSHPIVRASRARVPPTLARFAGVLVDVLYDHHLARAWDRHAADAPPLRTFVDDVHADLTTHAAALPDRLRAVTPRLVAEDWLGSYGSRDGLRRVLQRMERRLRRPASLASVVDVIDLHGAAWAADFDAFYPQLRAFVAAERAAAP